MTSARTRGGGRGGGTPGVRRRSGGGKGPKNAKGGKAGKGQGAPPAWPLTRPPPALPPRGGAGLQLPVLRSAAIPSLCPPSLTPPTELRRPPPSPFHRLPWLSGVARGADGCMLE